LEHAAPETIPVKTGFTLLYVGRLVPVKNHSLLLKAFHLALSTLPDLRLWIVGDGNERQRTETLAAHLGISTQVTFWGQQMEVAPFFSAADAFIMSSTSEGLPMSLLQAFSLGLPAIVTDVGGMSEVVRLARAGMTVSLADPKAMAAAILRFATSESERQHCGARAKASFEDRFSLESMVNAYFDLYRAAPRMRYTAPGKPASA
jgi:glycosyltransferase involved in cell wall biosynthesis